MVLDVAADGFVIARDWNRDKRRSDNAYQELELGLSAAKDGGHIGWMRPVGRPHPGPHVLPRDEGALVGRGKHLLRDWDLEDGFEPIFAVDIRAKLPH